MSRLPTFKQLRAQVDEVEKFARARTVSDSTLRTFLEDCRKVRAYAKRHGLTGIDVRADGGAVPNSYKYPAEATHLTWDGATLSVRRGAARHQSGGGWEGVYMARVRDPGHKSTGRCRKHAGWAYPLD